MKLYLSKALRIFIPLLAIAALITISSLPSCKVQDNCDMTATTYSVGIDGLSVIVNSGGTTPYTYIWSNGATTQAVTGLAPGTYTVTITDAKQCSAAASGTIDNISAGCGPTIFHNGKEYFVTQIGTQCWMGENLDNEDGMGPATDSLGWVAAANSHTPAWCYYGDAGTPIQFHGKLYNWYALQSPTLCPSGWHVPTDDDWQILISYAGGESEAGGALKAISGWDAPNVGATDSLNFGSDPSGGRSPMGYFFGAGTNAQYWTNTLGSDTNNAKTLLLWNYATDANLVDAPRGSGFSCRCVKD